MLEPGDKSQWTGRVDEVDGVLGHRWHQIVEFGIPSDVNLLGFASDIGVRRNDGRPGAAEGPASLRATLSNLPVHDTVCLRDLGTIRPSFDDLELAQKEYAIAAGEHLSPTTLVVGLGGGHEIAWAGAQAMQATFPDSTIGILNIDAHFDLRESPEATSGTSFLAALKAEPEKTKYCVAGISRSSNTMALYNRAQQYGVRFYEDMAVYHDPDGVCEGISEWIGTVDHLYLTVCLDAFPQAVAPGVSAPASLGISVPSGLQIVETAAASGKLRMMDVAELNPPFDRDLQTARLGARLIFAAVNSWLEVRR